MAIKFYFLLSFNILMLIFLTFFIYSRGGIQYLQAKYKQIVQREDINSNLIKFKNSRIESFIKSPILSSDILIIGDSISEYGEWSEYMNNCRIKNRGIGGETSSGLKEWFSTLAEREPAEIILLIGINNFKSGISLQKINGYLNDITFICKHTSKKTTMNIVSILPINEPMARGFIHCKNSDLININKQLKTITNKFDNVEYIDAFKNMLNKESEQLDPSYTIDGVHLTYDGYIKYITSSLANKF